MRSDYKKVYGIIVRYSVLLVLSFFAIPVFYYIFLPLTKYPAFYFMDIFYDAFLKGDSIFIGVNIIEIAGACVAGSAYYLLLILNLGTPRIKNHERVKAIAFSFLVFLILNVIRIIFLGVLFVSSSPYFDFFHKILWYAGSTVIVVAIWFMEVKYYKLKEIPFYSDLKYLYNHSILNGPKESPKKK